MILNYPPLLLGERLDEMNENALEDLEDADLLAEAGMDDLGDLDFDMDDTIMDADMSSIIKVQ